MELTELRPLRHISVVIIFFFLLHLPVVSASENKSEEWRNDRLCGRSMGFPEAITMPGFYHNVTFCVEVSKGSRVCVGLIDPESGKAQVFIEKSGAVINKWDTKISIWQNEQYGKDSLRIDAVDLKGDQKEELLVAVRNFISNSGNSVEYWTIWAVDGNKVSKPISIEDYGEMGFPVKVESKQKDECDRCYLLVSRWIWGWEPKRGDGLYLVGRWFDYSNGEFSPTSDRPTIYRRYVNSFKNLRRGTGPFLWYSDKITKPIIGPHPFFE